MYGGNANFVSTAKMKSKMKFGAEDRISNALSSLDESLSEFEAELNICTQHRFGRMHEALIAQEKNIQKILDITNGKSSPLTTPALIWRLVCSHARK